ncbi:MAG: BMP family ABC transporter substrate-binding protein [Bdellovibrio sp.]|nr:BMP family ABC transporter substrate-binding protein [Bdellovibrio sp.]
MKKFVLFLILLITQISFAGIKLGIVLDKGGKDDKSFNASAFKGAMLAKDRLRFEVKDVEAKDDNSYEELLKWFASKNYDLIIGVGIAQSQAIKKVAAQFPKSKFAIVDAEVKAPNVRSLLFNEHEGAYLVGAIAGLTTKTGKIGFVGGMDIPLIRRFQMGYEAGAKKVNPKIQVLTSYVGNVSDAWNNPPKAKELALVQYGKGVDIIFTAAGASGLGVFDAAEEKTKFAIGVDSNQNGIKPGRILTSMLKRVDTAIFLTCSDLAGGVFTPGITYYGLTTGAIEYSRDENNAKILAPAVIKQVDKIKDDILHKKITVPDYYKKNK